MPNAQNMTTDEFDPAEHTVAEVVEHIDAHPDEAAQIIAAEEAGKARKGVLSQQQSDDGTTDYLGQAVSGDTDQLGRPIEDGKDYLGREVVG